MYGNYILKKFVLMFWVSFATMKWRYLLQEFGQNWPDGFPHLLELFLPKAGPYHDLEAGVIKC